MATRTTRIITIVLVFLLTLMACSLPVDDSSNQQQPDGMATGFAFATQTAMSNLLTLGAQPDTPQPPVVTDTLSLTFTPTLTSTPEIPLISVSVDTNCRIGPGKVYDWVGALLVGEQAEIVARSSQGDYFYIRNPDKPGEFCWLWGNYATMIGNVSILPVFTPPPTPTPAPDFTVTYEYMEGCVGWDPGFKVVNTGGVTFKSGNVKVKDTVTATTVNSSTDVFDKRNGCIVAQSIPNVPPGDSGWIYGNSFLYDPTGNAMEATVTLCTQPGLAGSCISRPLNFTP